MLENLFTVMDELELVDIEGIIMRLILEFIFGEE